MIDNQVSNRPEHEPRDYEWLPDAYAREIEPHGPDACEAVRQALAEGDIEAMLRDKFGQRYAIAKRMWDKEPLAKKVYPRFQDGWMRTRIQPYTGPYVEGWIFVRPGDLIKFIPGVESPASATHLDGPKREATRLVWGPIRNYGIELYQKVCPENPVDEVYERLKEEIKNPESALSEALRRAQHRVPLTKDAIARGLHRHFGNRWYGS